MFSINENKYTQMTDEQLIENIKNDDQMALNSLIKRYDDIVNMKASKFFMIGAEKEDIIQEGMIGLFKAIKSFDVEKEVSFKAFADLCVKRQIMTAIKSSTRQKHIPLNSYVSLNKTAFDDEDDRAVIEMLDMETVPDPLETITNEETYKKIEMKMNEVLSDFEQKVLSGYLDGESYSEIANSLGSHIKAVDNAVQRIKKKACKYIAEDM